MHRLYPIKTTLRYLSITICVVLLLVSSPFAVAAGSSGGGYVITLKNGKVIRSLTCSDKDGRITFEQFGSQVTISKETVLEVRKDKQGSSHDKTPARFTRGHLDLPVYLSVSGVENSGFNGLYEESGVHNDRPSFKQVNGRHMLFYAGGHGSMPVWSLGELGSGYSQISFVNSSIRAAGYPENQGGWTSGGGEIMYPRVKIVRTQPPGTVFKGNNGYVVRNFPLAECNGTYRPESISEGHISYGHEEKSFKLHYEAHSWMISFCPKNCFMQFSSKVVPLDKMPEDIDRWYDLSNTGVTGNVSIFRHPTTQ